METDEAAQSTEPSQSTDSIDSIEFAPDDELLGIVRSLRAHLEWQQSVGAVGLPRDPDAKRRLQEEWARQAPPSGAVLEPSSAGARERSGPGATAPSAPRPATESSSPVRLSVAAPAPPPRLAPGDATLAALDLGGLAARVAGCTACGLASTRTQTVFARGSGSSGICFVGEGPGAEEDARGEPFVGAAGQLLDRMIAAMGLERDEVYVCNVVKCRPPNNRKPAIEEMAACSGYLRRQLELLQPEVIVALGGTAVTGLLGLTEGITRLRGVFRLYEGTIPVMPTFHPAYLLRQPEAKREVWSDLRQVLARVGRTPPERAR